MYVERFLATFTDQALADLQAAAEDRKISYAHQRACLLGRHQDGYTACRNTELGTLAEAEYYSLGRKLSDEARQEALLPLIAAEWKRRDVLRPVNTNHSLIKTIAILVSKCL